MLKLFNTLTRNKDEFKSIDPDKVRIYTCGPTVYNFAHIGNFRAYICADLLKRYLKFKGYEVKHVMNLTDVDDKTIRDSQVEGSSLNDFTDKYIKAFFEDMNELNIDPANEYPKATDHIKEMVFIIKELEKKGLAYKGDDHSWYYKVDKFEEYGKLAKLKKENLKTGARVCQDEYEKDSVSDFALWKAWTKDDGDVFWETELGKGRPGWHIECSAMSTKFLGNHFDIHTGGVDLVFPHHENEIAQSEGCCSEKYVNYWIHNEWLLSAGKKMSKSLGNFYTLRDLINKGYNPLSIRYVLLTTHYRVQLNFTEEGIGAADASIKRLNELIRKLDSISKTGKLDVEENEIKFTKLIVDTEAKFIKEMDDDLSISNALAHIFEFVKETNRLSDKISANDANSALKFLKKIDSVLGVMNFLISKEEIPEEVIRKAQLRDKARKNKDWTLADKLRDEITALGYRIDDSSKGTQVIKS